MFLQKSEKRRNTKSLRDKGLSAGIKGRFKQQLTGVSTHFHVVQGLRYVVSQRLTRHKLIIKQWSGGVQYLAGLPNNWVADAAGQPVKVGYCHHIARTQVCTLTRQAHSSPYAAHAKLRPHGLPLR